MEKKMLLCDQYLHEYFLIDPTINDFFLKDEWTKKRNEQPNIYSEKYYNDSLKLNKKYFKILKENKELSYYDKILLHDIQHDIHMEEGYEIYMYMPINLMENILTDYVSECAGNGNYIFETKGQYNDFLKRLESLDGITDTIIEKMTDGIKEEVTLHKRNVSEMINNIQEVLKEKSYTHTKKIKIKKDLWENSVERCLVKNLMKFLDFLINEYYQHSQDNFGLESYKGGKKAYENILQNQK